METTEIILKYLRVLLSPQVMAGVVAVGFSLLFKEDIRALLRRIAKIRFPGGGDLSTLQAERASREATSREKSTPTPSLEQPPLPDGLHLTPEQINEITAAFQAERAKAYLWEYRYLNYFFVHNTQRVLDWFASLTTNATVGLYDSVWMPAIPSSKERSAILEAIQLHRLIEFHGELVEVTPKGREYHEWRGPQPSIPS